MYLHGHPHPYVSALSTPLQMVIPWPSLLSQVPKYHVRSPHPKDRTAAGDWPREESCISFWSGWRTVSIGNVVLKVLPRWGCTFYVGMSIWCHMRRGTVGEGPTKIPGGVSLLPRSKSEMDIQISYGNSEEGKIMFSRESRAFCRRNGVWIRS